LTTGKAEPDDGVVVGEGDGVSEAAGVETASRVVAVTVFPDASAAVSVYTVVLDGDTILLPF